MFDDVSIERLAGPGAFRRGLTYYADGRVTVLAASDSTIEALVDGTDVYRVELSFSRKRLGWDCTCPAAADGAFCKHAVATAIQIRENGGERGARAETNAAKPGRGRRNTATVADLRSYLVALAPEALVELVLDRTRDDAAFRRRLVDEMRAAEGLGPDLATWMARIDSAFTQYGGYVDYEGAGSWASGVQAALREVTTLADLGHHEAVIELCERAFAQAEAAIQYVDDSDGWITSIAADIGEMHLDACIAARPDPVAFARRLLDLELGSELDTFHHSAATYAEVLGDVGLAEFRRALLPRWDANPTRTEALSERRWGESYSVSEAMIGWALGTGDPDALIEVRSRDLSSASDYLMIARSLVETGRDNEALNWAKLGLVEHPGRGAEELRSLAVELLGRQGADRSTGNASAEIEQIRWDAFVQTPSRANFLTLCGLDPARRADFYQRCTQHLRERLEAEPGDTRRSPSLRPRAAWQTGVLIEVLVGEGDIEDAWQVAQRYGCSDGVRIDLAERREAVAPAEAIDVYEPLVLAAIDAKSNAGYEHAVALMVRIERLAPQAGTSERWTALLDRVRTEHKAKRNLRKLLDNRGW